MNPQRALDAVLAVICLGFLVAFPIRSLVLADTSASGDRASGAAYGAYVMLALFGFPALVFGFRALKGNAK
ncbi:MAG: hypothetical protein U0572_00345 [Phycisphaerales bacterium]